MRENIPSGPFWDITCGIVTFQAGKPQGFQKPLGFRLARTARLWTGSVVHNGMKTHPELKLFRHQAEELVRFHHKISRREDISGQQIGVVIPQAVQPQQIRVDGLLALGEIAQNENPLFPAGAQETEDRRVSGIDDRGLMPGQRGL